MSRMMKHCFWGILLSLSFGACNQDDEPLPPVETSLLIPGAEMITIHSARTVFPYSLNWANIDGVNEYTLRFSTDSAFPGDQTYSYTVHNSNAYTFPVAADFEALLANLHIPKFVSDTVYWAAIPVPARPDIRTKIQAFIGVSSQALSAEQKAVLANLPHNVVVAHRGCGASDYAPEQTEVAYRWARNMGADYLECDLQQTAEGVIVLLHDDDLIRTTDIKKVFPSRSNSAQAKTNLLTFAQLQQLDAGSWKGARFAGEQIPTLEDLIQVCEGYRYLRKKDFPGIYPKISAAAGRQRVTLGVDNVSEATLNAAGFANHIIAADHTNTVYVPDDKVDNGHRPGICPEIKATGSVISLNNFVSLLSESGWYNDDPARMRQIPVFNDGTHVAIANTDARVVIQSFSLDYLRECKNKFHRLRPMSFLLWDYQNAVDYSKMTDWIEAGVTILSPMIGALNGTNFNASKGRMIRNTGLYIMPYTFAGDESAYNDYAGKNVPNGNSAYNYLDAVITDNLKTAYHFYANLEAKFLFPNAALGWPDNLQANKLVPADPAKVITELGY